MNSIVKTENITLWLKTSARGPKSEVNQENEKEQTPRSMVPLAG